MADTTNINLRIDKELKERAEAFFADIGLSMTAAFTVFVRQALRQGKIPFEILGPVDPFHSPENTRALTHSLHELRTGQTVTKTLKDLKAME